MELIIIALIIVALAYIWKRFDRKKPLKTVGDFQRIAHMHDVEKKYNEAIEVRKKALKLEGLTVKERADFMFGIGGNYFLKQNYEDAAHYFDLSLIELKDENFPYAKQYERVIEAYVKANRIQEGKKVLKSLIKRQTYDKGFKKLEKLEDEFFHKKE